MLILSIVIAYLVAGYLVTRLAIYLDGDGTEPWTTGSLLACTLVWPALLMVMAYTYFPKKGFNITPWFRRLYGDKSVKSSKQEVDNGVWSD